MSRHPLFTLLFLTLSACRCTPGITTLDPARVVASPDRLVFPPTYLGQSRTQSLDLTNQGGQATSVQPRIDAPFTVEPESLSLVRGQSESLRVTFAPTAAGAVSRVLHLGDLEVQVSAEGLDVPLCVAPTSCVQSNFDLDAAVCREAPLPNGTACETSCLTGTCTDGTCQGQLEGCDDADACTLDACSETSGCSHAPITCPEATDPCRVARCDSTTGCGFEDATDGTLCGADDCKALLVDVCLSGQCVQRPRPATGRCANRWVPASIPGRGAHAMAWDGARRRLILFGGGTVPSSDTWEWDGQRWSFRTPAASPPARSHHAMAWDALRRRIILFGGRDAQGLALDDTWEWDGVTWLRRMPASAPSARTDHAMAYDAARQRVLLFGGQGSGTLLGDTWEWTGSSWLQRSPAQSPSARYLHELAFDASRQRVVLFAGYAATMRDDTWEWDGTTWVDRTPALGPGPRVYHALTYDPLRQRVVLFGGSNEQSTSFADTWTWDGASWTRLTPVRSPPFRAQHALAFDEVKQRVVLFGGFRANGSPDDAWADTWEFDGATWTPRAVVNAPLSRAYAAMTYDPVRQKVILFGGVGLGGAWGDHWEWDGATWTEPLLTNVPLARLRHAMTWDAAHQRVVLFGGVDDFSSAGNSLADTWTWDGASWTERIPSASPPARSGHLLSFDGQRALLVGGGLPDAWSWDGTTWTEHTLTARPSFTDDAAMVLDEARQRVVLFGGTGSAETWTWDGTAWTQQQPATSPPARGSHAMAYDSVRQRVVMFGGFEMPTLYDDTWEWDGVTWSRRAPATSPPASYGHVMAYDAARQRLVLFTGADTWLFLP